MCRSDAGVPDDVEFATKPALALQVITAAALPAALGTVLGRAGCTCLAKKTSTLVSAQLGVDDHLLERSRLAPSRPGTCPAWSYQHRPVR